MGRCQVPFPVNPCSSYVNPCRKGEWDGVGAGPRAWPNDVGQPQGKEDNPGPSYVLLSEPLRIEQARAVMNRQYLDSLAAQTINDAVHLT